MNLKIEDIIQVTKGKLVVGNLKDECENFAKDTRIIKPKDTYIGIKGETFDGSKFWKQALENGASTVIVENIEFSNEDLKKYKDKNIILVKNTIEALYKIAKRKRELYGKNFPLIGITGSVGKTSTKDIIANVVSQKYLTLKTEGNNNNNIGLPFTILNLREHEAAVIEMGMNHFNEISILTEIAKPTISVITNIGTSHIGNLGSRENILKAKLEILEGMDNKILVINNDNDLLNDFNKKNKEIKIYTYGIDNNSTVMAKDIVLNENGSEFLCILNQKEFKVKVPIGGIHFIYNAMCAAIIGNLLGLSIKQIQSGIETFELTKKRMDIIELENRVKIINDAYNASFESMQASLKYLSTFKNLRKIAVLGDMFELGDYSKELHEKVGKEIFNNDIDILICCGENAIHIAEKAKECGMNEQNVYYFKDKTKITNFIKNIWKEKDVILFKASNGMRFFDLVENLKEI